MNVEPTQRIIAELSSKIKELSKSKELSKNPNLNTEDFKGYKQGVMDSVNLLMDYREKLIEAYKVIKDAGLN